MANLCFVCYAIEGDRETLDKIKAAFDTPTVIDPESCETWLGNVLLTLGIDVTKLYDGDVCGFTSSSKYNDDNTALMLYTEDKWRRCDFGCILKNNFPNINVYYQCDMDDEGDYTTNDVEGKYFPERYIVDGDNDGMECFNTKDEMLKYIKEVYGETDESKFDDHEDFHTHEYIIEDL